MSVSPVTASAVTANCTYGRIALFGGIYSNYLALQMAIDHARQQGAEALFCLGDLGAFGPYPDRVFPLIQAAGIHCIRGNYDDSIGRALDDCQCGYTDARDNYFAALSYRYTLAHTSPENRAYLRNLPDSRRIRLGKHTVLLCHGSPRRTNEFLWESTTSTGFLQHLMRAHHTEVIATTHTGIKWHRALDIDGDGSAKHLVNVGVLGRPENDGQTNVWYTLLDLDADGQVRVQFVPIDYDYERLAREMESEGLPEEFAVTIRSGWWTTCLEILPSKERRRGRF